MAPHEDILICSREGAPSWLNWAFDKPLRQWSVAFIDALTAAGKGGTILITLYTAG